MITFTQEVDRWNCCYTKCGAACCKKGHPLTLFDINVISKKLGVNWHKFAEFDTKKLRFYLKGKSGDSGSNSNSNSNTQDGDKGDVMCTFLKDDLTCSIYDVKPLVCRLLPFEIKGVSLADEPLLQLKPLDVCPGYGRGPKLDNAAMWQIERDATLYLHENQKLCRKFKEDPEKVLKEYASD